MTVDKHGCASDDEGCVNKLVTSACRVVGAGSSVTTAVSQTHGLAGC